MKKIKMGLTALALIMGFVTVFANNTSRFIGSYWTIIGDPTHAHKTTAQAAALCPGSQVDCAQQFDANGQLTGGLLKINP